VKLEGSAAAMRSEGGGLALGDIFIFLSFVLMYIVPN
jgi:hypothetical protein